MLIGKVQPISFIDFPKTLAAVVFTQGCGFRCHFCHNPSLVLPSKFTVSIEEKKFFDFLSTRKNKLEGVVITGGEPTIHKDLTVFIKKIKDMGFSVKLDTSGINPDVLALLIEKNLLDYVAMDIKAPLQKYPSIVGKEVNLENIEKSVSLLLQSSLSYEFRTTILPLLHSREDILSIFEWIKGARCYILQKFNNTVTLNPKYKEASTFSDEEISSLAEIGSRYIQSCSFR